MSLIYPFNEKHRLEKVCKALGVAKIDFFEMHFYKLKDNTAKRKKLTFGNGITSQGATIKLNKD